MSDKLTWNPGENASWEGVEMTDYNHMMRFGCNAIMYDCSDNAIGYIIGEDMYYIGASEREAILSIINQHVRLKSDKYYESELDEAHGFVTTDTYNTIDNIESMVEIIKDFILIDEIPNTVKIDDYEEFMTALDDYFEKQKQR